MISLIRRASGIRRINPALLPESLAVSRTNSFPAAETISRPFSSAGLSSKNALLPCSNKSVNTYLLSERRQFMDLRKALLQRFSFSTSASPEATEKDTNSPSNGQGSDREHSDASHDGAEGKTDEVPATAEQTDAEAELSMDDLIKLAAEQEELLKIKHEEIKQMQDKVLRSYAEMENVIERTKRDAENSKKFATQSFSKSLLDVADNLGRACSVVKESFAKIDTSSDTTGAVQLLKTLLEGVEMTEKQLSEVFKKFGVEKFESINEPFDPNKHMAVFQVPDPSKPAGTIAVVLKSGYMLYDRVLRPAEVGVTDAPSEQVQDPK